MQQKLLTFGIIGIVGLSGSFALAEKQADKQFQPDQASCSIITDKMELARRGCCSHHGGVCGCSGGSIKCCDGSFSPSCGCKHDDTQLKPSVDDNAN